MAIPDVVLPPQRGVYFGLIFGLMCDLARLRDDPGKVPGYFVLRLAGALSPSSDM